MNKHKPTQLILTWMLSIVMVLAMAPPIMAFEELSEETIAKILASGNGFSLDSEGTLIISNNAGVVASWRYDSGLTEVVETVIIEKDVTEIPYNSFDNCRGLTTITVSSENTSFIVEDNVLYTMDKKRLISYPPGRQGSSFIIPDTVETISAQAFRECLNLKNVTIPNSVTTIASGAFYLSSELTSMTISSFVETIGDFAFFGCSGLTDISVENDNAYYTTENGVLYNKDKTNLIIYSAKKTASSFAIPNTVTEISAGAFYGAAQLREISIPNSVTRIGVEAFGYCRGLVSITIPNSINILDGSLFHDCTGLVSVIIPNTVTEIGVSAFKGCLGLVSVTIPDSVTKINSQAFYGCTGLTSMSIPDSVRRIDSQAFGGSTNLSLTLAYYPMYVAPPFGFDWAYNVPKVYYPSLWDDSYISNSGSIEQIPYDNDYDYLTVQVGAGGSVSGTVSDEYYVGTPISLTANANDGYRFTGWDVSGDAVIMGGSTANPATFNMPIGAVTLTAQFEYTSGGSSNDSSDSGSNTTVSPPPAEQSNASNPGEIKVDAQVSGGNARADITEEAIADAFDKVLAEAKKNGKEQSDITLVLAVNTRGQKVNSLTFNLPKSVQDFIISQGIANTVLVMENLDITISMDAEAVKEINKQAGSDVNIIVTRRDNSKLTGSARAVIGSRPVFDLRVSHGDGKLVSSFGAGSVSVAIPYTSGAGENAGNIQAVFVDEKGQVQWLLSSVYDSLEQILRFTTSHFSIYGVGYKQEELAFTDIDNHWAKDDIAFVVNSGLFGGTSATTFSPNIAMTRGMFVTTLGRLAKADVSTYKETSFNDVKDNAYYMEYIEWANKNGIVNGIGNNRFAPDQFITREQMAAIMSNYAKTIGFALPKVHGENTFEDKDKISDYAKEAVKQMQMAGIISGKNDNLFDPQGMATRAEVSAVLRRFVELN